MTYTPINLDSKRKKCNVNIKLNFEFCFMDLRANQYYFLKIVFLNVNMNY